MDDNIRKVLLTEEEILSCKLPLGIQVKVVLKSCGVIIPSILMFVIMTIKGFLLLPSRTVNLITVSEKIKFLAEHKLKEQDGSL